MQPNSDLGQFVKDLVEHKNEAHRMLERRALSPRLSVDQSLNPSEIIEYLKRDEEFYKEMIDDVKKENKNRKVSKFIT